MIEIPLKKPKPDFDNLTKVLSGEKIQTGVISAELLVDEEIKKNIIEHYFNERNVPLPRAQRFGSTESENNTIDTGELRSAYRNYHRSIIEFYYRMGYHFIPDLEYFLNFSFLNNASRIGKDTALLSRGERFWAEEGKGMIQSWEDFERFPWKKARTMLSEYGNHLQFPSKNLPDGMKIAAQAALYKPAMEWLLGYEGLFYGAHDQPELVEAVFDTYGQLIYDSYVFAATFDEVGVIWHGVDLGYKTAALLSPDLLKKWVSPWFKKFGEIAHKKINRSGITAAETNMK
jgi:uroporphyrinogen decarboxylase